MNNVKAGDKIWVIDCQIHEGLVINGMDGKLTFITTLPEEDVKQYRAIEEVDYQNKAIDLMIAKLTELKEK
jgi:hypothetical protein